jgi:hypothetical protein
MNRRPTNSISLPGDPSAPRSGGSRPAFRLLAGACLLALACDDGYRPRVDAAPGEDGGPGPTAGDSDAAADAPADPSSRQPPS